MKIKIEVTAKDIVDGCPQDGEYCPIALAAARAGLQSVFVDEDGLYADGFEGLLPDDAVDFIRAFDQYEAVEPITFEIEKS